MSSSFEIFDNLCNSRDVKQLLINYEKLNEFLDLNKFIKNIQFFYKLKSKIQKSKQILKFNKISSILQKLDKRCQQKIYSNNQRLCGQRVLVIGGGISGLRVAIELLLLGADVICVEKRDTFSRNNVIHLWPNVIQDLRLLAAKRFYGRFCVGSIDHISIRQIQLILLKIALIYGLKFYPNITFDKLCPKLFTTTSNTTNNCLENDCLCCCHSHGVNGGAKVHLLDSTNGERIQLLETELEFDIIIGADGRRNTLFQDFPRKEFRGKLAIAITANFVNKRSEEEVRVPEISGVSYIYAQKWFKELLFSTGIQLENICYYRDETHYFVMTATKQSLLSRGVLIKDMNETHLLLNEENIDRKALLCYARDAAQWTSGLKNLEFALNASHSPDVALFDFTSVYAARNASRAKRVNQYCCQEVKNNNNNNKEKHILMLLTGDSLLEPFWPTGSGAGRGFLSALDGAWCALQWNEKVVKQRDILSEKELEEKMIDVLAERESVYRLLAQTTPETIKKDLNCFSLQPINRYINWRPQMILEVKQQIKHLIQPISSEIITTRITPKESLSAKRQRRATVAITSNVLRNEQLIEDKREKEIQFNYELREERKQINEENNTKRLKDKANWLLGDNCQQNSQLISNKPKKKKNEDIIERAKELERVLRESQPKYSPKLAKVGKIQENDWNFKIWENIEEKDKNIEIKKRKELPENSRELLESRKQQIQREIEEKQNLIKKSEENRVNKREETKEWVKRMSEELKQRMERHQRLRYEQKEKKSKEQVEEEQESIDKQLINNNKVINIPQCVRCGLQVSAVERISVSGDVLHRSCLRCSKCGISLRLNEFRNELKFLCVFCLKSTNNRYEEEKRSSDWTKAKERFLREQQSIDFRERVEFENKEKEKTVEPEEEEEDESEITFDVTTDEESSDTSDDSDDWLTTDDDEAEEEEEEEEAEEDREVDEEQVDNQRTSETIPSICVTSDIRLSNISDREEEEIIREELSSKTSSYGQYCGQFTEKLFRSKSQPMLFSRRLKAFKEIVPSVVVVVNDDDIDDNDSDLLPFADIGGVEQHFSPVRALKAPIIEFKDI